MDIAAERAFQTPLSNSTLLPLLLLSLAKQRYTPEPSKTVMSEYDYVIVGAGSAGSVIANRLSELPCVSILLLEAGGPPPLISEVPGVARFLRGSGSEIDWFYRTVPQKHTGNGLVNRQLIWNYGKAIGGTTVFHNLLYVRGNRKNYDRWAEEGAEGWSYKEVLPYFKKMEGNRDLEYVINGYHGKQGPQTVQRPRYQSEIKDPIFKTIKAMGYKVVDPNADRQTGFYDFQATLRGGQRCSVAKAYLVPAENRTNLDILPNAMVRKVVIKDRRAVGVRFDFQGKTYTVKAKKEVIMSAGTVNTAQLLLLSGVGPKEHLEQFQIPVHADLPVGKNLQDHIGSFTNFQVKPFLPKGSDKLSNRQNVIQYIQNRTGPLTAVDFDSALAFLKNRAITPKRDFPDHQLYFAEAEAALFLPLGVKPEVVEQVYGPYEQQGFMICVSQILNPRSRGTVTLKSKNPYQSPAIDPNYLEDPKDVQDIVEGMKTCMRIGTNPIMKQSGIVPFDTLYPGCEKYVGNTDKYFTCVARSVVSTFGNYVGTARMGDPKDPRTVVDPQLRVLHIKGLRVVDASVIPIIPSGNTNIPTMMVAEKASDIIKSTIECNGKKEEQWSETDDPGWSDEPHNYPLDPDSDSKDKHEDEWTDDNKDSDWSDEPHNYPLDPDSDNQEENEESWDEKEDSSWSKEPKQHPVDHDSDVKHGKDILNIESPGDIWVTPWNKEIPNVIPWNQEIVQFNPLQENLPLNTSVLNSNLQAITNNPILSNIPGQASLNPSQSQAGVSGSANNQQTGIASITNNPVLSSIQSQVPGNPQQPQTGVAAITNNPILSNIQGQLPLNPQQPQAGLPGIANNPVLSNIQSQLPFNPQQSQAGLSGIANNPVLSNIQSQLPFNPQQAQASLPGIANNPVLSNVQLPFNTQQSQAGLPGISSNPASPNIQQQLPFNPLQPQSSLSPSQPQTPFNPLQPQSPNDPPEIKSYLEPEDSHSIINSPHSHGHHQVIPWNKEIPNVIPWNQELLQSPLTAGTINGGILNAGLQNIANNPVASNAQVPLPLNPQQQLPLNPLQPQIPGLSSQSQASALPSQPQIPLNPSQSLLPALTSQLQNPQQAQSSGMNSQQVQSPGMTSQLQNSQQAQSPGMTSQLQNSQQAQRLGMTSQLQNSQQAQSPGIGMTSQLQNSQQAQSPGITSQSQNSQQPQMPGFISQLQNLQQSQIPGLTSQLQNLQQSQTPGLTSQLQNIQQPQTSGITSQLQNSQQPQISGLPAQLQNLQQLQIPGLTSQSQTPMGLPQLPFNPAQPQGIIAMKVNKLQGQMNGGATTKLTGKVNQMKSKLQRVLQQLLSNPTASAPPVNPAVLRDLQRIRQNTPCDREFCDALLNFMQCQERSCERRREFSSYMHSALCST